jgi:hypothetical protein
VRGRGLVLARGWLSCHQGNRLPVEREDPGVREIGRDDEEDHK